MTTSTMAESKPDPATSTENTPSTTAPTTESKTEGSAKAATDKDTSTSSYTEMATNAATGVAGTATTAAAGMKDSVFSMFGGGAKKDKAPEEAGEPDRSGSSKAHKDAEAAKEEGGEEGVSAEGPVNEHQQLGASYMAPHCTAVSASFLLTYCLPQS
jgi:Ran-binding protein 1